MPLRCCKFVFFLPPHVHLLTGEFNEQKVGAKSELGESCFKLVTVALRHCEDYRFNDKDLDFLLSMASHNLEDIHNHSPTFSLLKA